MTWKRVSAHEAVNLVRNAQQSGELALFDSRDVTSYTESHIRGADHLSERIFGEVITVLPKDVPVMIYCYHGNASQVYAQWFSDFKFEQVYSVDGGYEALADAYQAKH